MKVRAAILLVLTPLMAMDDTGSCDPASLEAAGVRPGDGGVWVNGPDGGTFITNTQLIDRPLRDLPSDEMLCMLYPGDLNEANDYPTTQGIWIEDIKSPWFLGPVDGDGDTRDQEGAQLRYTYRNPASNLPEGVDTITIMLRFETIPAVTLPATEGIPWAQPYFLNGISAMGMDKVQMSRGGKSPSCWDWKLRETPDYANTPCPNCKSLDVDFRWCREMDPRDCYRRK